MKNESSKWNGTKNNQNPIWVKSVESDLQGTRPALVKQVIRYTWPL